MLSRATAGTLACGQRRAQPLETALRARGVTPFTDGPKYARRRQVRTARLGSCETAFSGRWRGWPREKRALLAAWTRPPSSSVSTACSTSTQLTSTAPGRRRRPSSTTSRTISCKSTCQWTLIEAARALQMSMETAAGACSCDAAACRAQTAASQSRLSAISMWVHPSPSSVANFSSRAATTSRAPTSSTSTAPGTSRRMASCPAQPSAVLRGLRMKRGAGPSTPFRDRIPQKGHCARSRD
mmetsp:Transcript_15480/g.45277  ORF Transcript_15480/g.45277 Transcript_15480/m.45277 type:complete len:241 (+) Transcript_15480:320-1042(+)